MTLYLRIVSRHFLNISREGDSTTSVGKLGHLHCKEVVPHVQVELHVFQFLLIASHPIAWHH